MICPLDSTGEKLITEERVGSKRNISDFKRRNRNPEAEWQQTNDDNNNNINNNNNKNKNSSPTNTGSLDKLVLPVAQRVIKPSLRNTIPHHQVRYP